MKSFKERGFIRKAVWLLVIIPTTLFVLGQGCSVIKGFNPGSASSGDPLTNASSDSMCKVEGGVSKDVEVLPGQATVSIVYDKQVLDNMVACTGIGTASLSTQKEWEIRRTSLSEYGLATDVSGPMMMAISGVAGEVCNDLITKESGLAPASRGIFSNLDLASNASNVNGNDIDSAVNNLASSCWQRAPTSEERQLVTDAVIDLIQGTSANINRQAAISLCTAVLSSISAISM